MGNLQPPFKFKINDILGNARRFINKRVDGATINLPFLSFSVRPEDIERKVARELVIRLVDKRVLNASECCDNCIEHALASLQEIRTLLVDKQVELAGQTDGILYLMMELMLEGIRQFFTFEENLHSPNAVKSTKYYSYGRDKELCFAALETLRGHLYRCLSQIAVLADMKIPKIPPQMRYSDTWQLEAYEKPDLSE